MPSLIPPTPVGGQFGSYTWQDWYNKVRLAINNGANIAWSQITSFAGSNLTSLVTRNHNDLQTLQGGNGSTEYYHLNLATYNKLIATKPAFKTSLSASHAITAATYTKVVFDTVAFDATSAWDSTNKRWNPKTAGYYQISMNALATAAAGTLGATIAAIWKNGANAGSGEFAAADTALIGAGTVSLVVHMNGTTDYVEGFIFISGGTTPLATTHADLTWFSGVLVSAD